jgi:transcriptional regulator with XRE-family HTH domain
MAEHDLLVPLLKAERERRGWSQRRLVRELRKVATREGEALPDTEALVSMISRWENGHRNPSVFYRHLLRQVYGDIGVARGTVQDHALAHTSNEELSDRLAVARTCLVRLDAGLLTDLSALTDIYRRMDRRLGVSAVLDELRKHYARVVELCGQPIRIRFVAAEAGAAATRQSATIAVSRTVILRGMYQLLLGYGSASRAPVDGEHRIPVLHTATTRRSSSRSGNRPFR